ncbi:MAG: LuxR C-terminal-related transcriptional regulator [Litorimonas sp.]
MNWSEELLAIAAGASPDAGLEMLCLRSPNVSGVLIHRFSSAIRIERLGSARIAPHLTKLTDRDFSTPQCNPLILIMPRLKCGSLVKVESLLDALSFRQTRLHRELVVASGSGHTGLMMASRAGGRYVASIGVERGSSWFTDREKARIERGLSAIITAIDLAVQSKMQSSTTSSSSRLSLLLDDLFRPIGCRRQDLLDVLKNHPLDLAIRSAAGSLVSRDVDLTTMRSDFDGQNKAGKMERSSSGRIFHVTLDRGPCFLFGPSVRLEIGPPHILLWEPDDLIRHFGFLPREASVCQMFLRTGSTNRVARALRIKRETVRVYMKSIYQKLDVSSQGELAAYFLAMEQET